jgi:protein TonB
MCGAQAASLKVGVLSVPAFLDRLQSGFLLFGTAQGLVRVEPSFWQRVYLLWTFRNFRRLSIPLLNSRQRELVYALFRDGAGTVSQSHNPWLAIGVVENFVPPKVQTGASTAQTKERPKVVVRRAEITRWLGAVQIARKLGAILSSAPRVAWSRVGTTLGVLSLCVISAASWRGIAGMPHSQAQNQAQLQLVNAPLSPSRLRSKEPAVAERPPVMAPPATASLPLAVPNVAANSAPIIAVIPTPKQEISTQAEVSTPNLEIRTPTATSTPNHEIRTQAAISTPSQETRIPAVVSTPNLPVSGQDSLVPASRPPLHVIYPVCPDVRARGVVALTAQVDSDGTVRGVRVVSGNHALAAAAVRAVRQWRYRPYLKDGQPVATQTNIAISFISDDAISMSFPPSLPASR